MGYRVKTFQMTISAEKVHSPIREFWGDTVSAAFIQASELLKIWGERRIYRSELRRLQNVGPHMIRDIGMTVGETLREAAKPFWRK